jgi:hypothetical protein
MRRPCRKAIMLAMTNPLTPSKVLLVADSRTGRTRSELAPVRRYRLARVRLDGRALTPRARPSALRRVAV